jgi:hypothetical protein
MLVVGPEIPASLRPFALSVVEAIVALQVPGSPTPLFACDEADLPPAANWPDHALKVSDLDIVAVSNGTSWIRQDTGAAI